MLSTRKVRQDLSTQVSEVMKRTQVYQMEEFADVSQMLKIKSKVKH